MNSVTRASSSSSYRRERLSDRRTDSHVNQSAASHSDVTLILTCIERREQLWYRPRPVVSSLYQQLASVTY